MARAIKPCPYCGGEAKVRLEKKLLIHTLSK